MTSYTIKTLETSVQNLYIGHANSINDGPPKLSLLSDPLFKHLYNKEETDDRGFTHFEQVVKFQESLDLYFLLDYQPFLEAVKATEPGRHISYKAIRADFDKVQHEIQGGEEVIQEMDSFQQRLSFTHRRFVMLSCALTSMELYSKITLRQYQIVRDVPFSKLPELNGLLYSIAFRDYAPSYTELRSKIDESIFHLRNGVKQATQDLATIKTSAEFKDFRAKLNTAHQIYHVKLARSSKQAQRSAYAASISFAKRLEEMKAKNEQAQKRRVNKNAVSKSTNLANLHQLGNQSRVPLQDTIIEVLSTFQVKHGEAVFDKPESDDGEEESDSSGDDDLHDAVEDMTVDGQAQQGAPEYIVEGIEIPEGFEIISSPIVVHGN